MTDSSGRVRPTRPAESMSLLVDIAATALEPGYAAAAARRPAGPSRSPRPALLVATLLAATLLVVVAAVQAHRQAPAAARARSALLDRIHVRDQSLVALEHRLDALRARTTALQSTALSSSRAGERLTRALAAEELAAGTIPVTGPGLRVTLDDSADGRNRVLDHDLQLVVNALWAGGAEAVAVGGERVTTQTAIRQAGTAILVNFQPLSPPYEVDAIGDPVAVETAFGSSAAAARMRSLAELYGLRFRYARADSLALPAAPGLTLRFATQTRSAP